MRFRFFNQLSSPHAQRQVQKLGGGVLSFVTYPFTDYAVNDVAGDYVNVDVKLDLDLTHVLSDIANASTPLIPLPSSVTGAVGNSASGSGSTLPKPCDSDFSRRYFHSSLSFGSTFA